MKTLVQAALIFVLMGMATAQHLAINSMSSGTTQNQRLSGETGHSIPPAPVFTGGVPDSGDRVSGTPANATTMHVESESMTSTSANPPASEYGKLAQQATFEGASPNSARAAKRTQH